MPKIVGKIVHDGWETLPANLMDAITKSGYSALQYEHVVLWRSGHARVPPRTAQVLYKEAELHDTWMRCAYAGTPGLPVVHLIAYRAIPAEAHATPWLHKVLALRRGAEEALGVIPSTTAVIIADPGMWGVGKKERLATALQAYVERRDGLNGLVLGRDKRGKLDVHVRTIIGYLNRLRTPSRAVIVSP